MNSITATYPGFQALPKGIKRMLVVSENLFFEESKGLPQDQVGLLIRSAGSVAEMDLKVDTSFLYRMQAAAARPF